MAQGYLVKTIIYSKLEERLAAVPGTKETTGLSGIGGFIERTMQDMEFDAILCTKCLQIRTVGLVRNCLLFFCKSSLYLLVESSYSFSQVMRNLSTHRVLPMAPMNEAPSTLDELTMAML